MRSVVSQEAKDLAVEDELAGDSDFLELEEHQAGELARVKQELARAKQEVAAAKEEHEEEEDEEEEHDEDEEVLNSFAEVGGFKLVSDSTPSRGPRVTKELVAKNVSFRRRHFRRLLYCRGRYEQATLGGTLYYPTL